MAQIFQFLVFATIFVFCFNVSSAQEEENSNSTMISCYDCDGTEECILDQDPENSTISECDNGQHCWIWSTEDNDEESYKRSCGDPCSDESREMDCKTTGNLTECSLCCSDDLCNDRSVNGGRVNALNNALLWWLLSGVAFLKTAMTN